MKRLQARFPIAKAPVVSGLGQRLLPADQCAQARGAVRRCHDFAHEVRVLSRE